MNGISPGQLRCLRFYGERIVETGMSPTLREAGTGLGIRSTNGVTDHLRRLARKGYMLPPDRSECDSSGRGNQGSRSRGWRVTELGWNLLGHAGRPRPPGMPPEDPSEDVLEVKVYSRIQNGAR